LAFSGPLSAKILIRLFTVGPQKVPAGLVLARQAAFQLALGDQSPNPLGGAGDHPLPLRAQHARLPDRLGSARASAKRFLPFYRKQADKSFLVRD